MEEEKSNKSESGELIIIGVRHRRKEQGFYNFHTKCSSRAEYYSKRAKQAAKVSKEQQKTEEETLKP